ncbi:hypothetical protein ACFE04_007928 [Oxalis oulophora]
MDGNKRDHFRKRPNNQFKRKGVSKKPRRDNWGHSEQSSGSSHSDETTVYRILCPSKKIGGVIGKGGNIVKALRDETRAKITVAESVPGSDERVIIIYSSPSAIPKKQDSDDQMTPQCAAQDALLKVHDRILEEDLSGGVVSDDENTTIRLLVPNNLVGCLLGKGGDVITRLRTETGASIRVLPAAHLPPCADSSDELVQISGQQKVAKRALYKVSTLLHQNPRKDKPPSSFMMPHGRSHFPAPGGPMSNRLPPENPMWAHRNHTSLGMPPPAPWMEGLGNHASRTGPGGFDRAPPEQAGDVSAEFSMKILCSTDKIGGVIGKGGFNVRQLQQETGATIHVEDAATDSEELVIRVSAFEALWNPRSQTIDTILDLMNKTSAFSEKGTFITRLLVPSTKVGCLLGHGGHVINEMRKRTQADIKVYSKDDKPKCAAEDEELVQISGSFGSTKDALAEILMRLRARTMRDANANGAAHSSSSGPPQGVGPSRSFLTGGPLPPVTLGPRRSGAYEPLRGGGHEFGPRAHHVPPAAGFRNLNNALEAKIPYNPVSSNVRTGSHISKFSEGPGARVDLPEIQSGGSERVIGIHGSAERLLAAQYVMPSGQNVNPQPGSHQQTNANSQPGPHQNAQQNPYQNTNAQQNPYENINAQQNPYQNKNAPHNPYQNINAQDSRYQNINVQRSPYQNVNAQQNPYQNISAQQSPYQNVNPQQKPYQSNNSQQSPYPVSAQQNLYPDISQQQGAYPGINASQNAHHNYVAPQGAYQPRL